MPRVTADSTIDYIIGLPPGFSTDEVIKGRTQTVMENSMPIAKIYPGMPSFTDGHSLFTRRPAFRGDGEDNNSYMNILNSHGYDLKQPSYSGNTTNEGCIVVAYLADSFPTDSFSNEYGEIFLKSLTNVASEGFGTVAQVTGSRTFGDVKDKLVTSLRDKGVLGEMGATGIETVGDVATGALQAIFGKRTVAVQSALLAGGRLDMPMIWKGSSFQPSYTMTIRLYNPDPGSKAATQKYIAAPLAALMLLGIPISTDTITYNYPFIHKIHSPGIYNIDPAFISNVTVIKGGDQQQIAFSQRLAVVDVRIDFGSLYSSLLASRGHNLLRPTLTSYLDALVGVDSEKQGIKNFSSVALSPGLQNDLELVRERRSSIIQETKNQAPLVKELTDADRDSPPPRVSNLIKQKSANLIERARGVFGF